MRRRLFELATGSPGVQTRPLRQCPGSSGASIEANLTLRDPHFTVSPSMTTGCAHSKLPPTAAAGVSYSCGRNAWPACGGRAAALLPTAMLPAGPGDLCNAIETTAMKAKHAATSASVSMRPRPWARRGDDCRRVIGPLTRRPPRRECLARLNGAPRRFGHTCSMPTRGGAAPA